MAETNKIQFKIVKDNSKFIVCNNDKYNDKRGVTDQSSDERENNTNKKRKIIPYNTPGDSLDMRWNKWLTDIPLSNVFSILTQDTDEMTEPMDITVPKAVTSRPPPIHIEAEIIEPLSEL